MSDGTNLKALINLRDSQLANRQEIEMQLNRLKTQICQRLRAGETTGDRIEDAIIASNGGLSDPRLTSRYRKAAGMISGKRGQLVALVILTPEKLFSHSERSILEQRVLIGRLSGDVLNVDLSAFAAVTLPTGGKHLVLHPYNDDFQVIRKDMEELSFPAQLDEPISPHSEFDRHAYAEGERVHVRLLAGDSEVQGWMKEKYLRAPADDFLARISAALPAGEVCQEANAS